MKRKRKAVVVILICAITFWIIKLNVYNNIVKSSPEKISSTTATIESVTLLDEYTIIVSKDGIGTRGIAAFETNGKIYLLGHSIEEVDESLAFKVEMSSNDITVSDLMGIVIANEEKGVIVEQTQAIREYQNIPIARTAQLGEAFILARDEEENICQYPIIIEAFQEEYGIFYYESLEMNLGNGTSGAPIIQNGELIGIHYGETENQKGVGRIIWNLEIVLS